MAEVVAQSPPKRARVSRASSRRMLPRPQSVVAAVVVFVVSVALLRAASYPVVSEPVAWSGDTIIAATPEQLQQGITLAVAPGLAGAATATPTIQQIRPFSVVGEQTDSSGTRFAVLKVSSPVPAAGQYTAAMVAAHGLNWKLSVTVMPDPIVPVAAVVAGLLISYGIGLWENVLSPGLQLQHQSLDLLWTISWVDNQPIGILPRDRSLDTGDEDVGTKGHDKKAGVASDRRFSITGAARAMVLHDPVPPDNSITALIQRGDLQQARSRLQDLQSLFADYQTFLYAAADVADAYVRIKATIDDLAPEPKALKAWDRFFENPRGRYEIRDAGALSALSTRIKGLADLYANFERINIRLNVALELSETLAAQAPSAPPEIENARANLAEAAADLWEAVSTDDLASWRVEQKVEDTLAAIRKVTADRHVSLEASTAPENATPMPNDQPFEHELSFARAAAFRAFRSWKPSSESHEGPENRLLSARSMLAKNLSDMPEPAGAADVDYQASLLRGRELIRLGDVAVLVVGILVAALTALSSLYEGKALSSPLEYAALFTWGVGVDQGMKGILGVLNKLGVPTPGSATITS